MSIQYDVTPGVDLSALSSATLAQVTQAISQLAPLSNIGGIIVGTTYPDVVNNPRFIRYIWLDISTPSNPSLKRYVGTRSPIQDGDAFWTAYAVADDSIHTSMIHAIADTSVDDALAGVNIGKLKRNANGTATAGDANKLVVIDSNGRYVTVASFASFLTNGIVPLTALDATGETYRLMTLEGNVPAWRRFDPNNNIFSGSEVPITKLLCSSGNGYKVLRGNAGSSALEFAYPTVLQRARYELTSRSRVQATRAINAVALSTSDGGSIDSSFPITFTPLLASTSKVIIRGIIHAYFDTSVTRLVTIVLGSAVKLGGIELCTTGLIKSIPFEAQFTNPGTATNFDVRIASVSAADCYINCSANTGGASPSAQLFDTNTAMSYVEILEVI